MKTKGKLWHFQMFVIEDFWILDSKQQDVLLKSLHTYTCMLLISSHLTSYPGNCQLRSSEMWRACVPAAESRSLSFCPQPWMDSTAFEASRNLCCKRFFSPSTTQQSRDTTVTAISRKPGALDLNQRLRRKRSHSGGSVTHSAFCRRYLTTSVLVVSTGNHSEKY